MKRANDQPITEGLATVLPIETNEVFYNPAQVFNRDLSVVAISVYARQQQCPSEIKVFEGLAASGLRSVRYMKELQFGAFEVTANDIEAIAVERMRKNFTHNGLDNEKVSAINSDAIVHMHLNKGRYDVIDLDPYGSCSVFLDSAVSSVKSGGLLCITSTDGGVLCGNQVDMSYIRYGGFSLKENYQHEMGLRVMLNAITSAASRHKRSIKVLAAFSIDFYFRVFVQVVDHPKGALNSIVTTGSVYQCINCEYHRIQPLSRLEGCNQKSARLVISQTTCTQCDSPLSIGGPMYLGPLMDETFVDNCLVVLEDEQDKFPGITSWAKIRGLLFGLKSELIDVPLFYTVPGLTSSVKISPPKLKVFAFYLRALGYRVGGSHRTPNSIKTDAPGEVVFDLLRLYCEAHPSRNQLKPKLPQILEKPITVKIPQDIDIDWNRKIENEDRVPIYLPNPKPFWGPKPKAITAHEDNTHNSKRARHHDKDE